MNLHQGLVVRFIRSGPSETFKTFAKSTVHTMANSTINLAASKTRHTVYQIIGTYIPYATADFIESAMRDISADKATERLQAYIAAHPVVETTRMDNLLTSIQLTINHMLAHPLSAIKQLEKTATSDMLDNVMLYGNNTAQTSTTIGNLIAKFLFFHALTARDIDAWVGQQGEDVNKSTSDITIQDGIAYECAGIAIDTLLWGYDAALISNANEDTSVDDILVTAIDIWSMYYIDVEIHTNEDVEYLVAVLDAIKTDPENTDSPDSDTLIEHCNSVIARLNTWLDMQH